MKNLIVLRKVFLVAAIATGVIGFGDFGESMYWALGRPFSVILLVLYCTFRALEGESAEYLEDMRTRQSIIDAAASKPAAKPASDASVAAVREMALSSR